MSLTMRPTGGHSPVYADRQDWTILDEGKPVGRIYEDASEASPLTGDGPGQSRCTSGRMPESPRAGRRQLSTRRRPSFNATGSPGRGVKRGSNLDAQSIQAFLGRV